MSREDQTELRVSNKEWSEVWALAMRLFDTENEDREAALRKAIGEATAIYFGYVGRLLRDGIDFRHPRHHDVVGRVFYDLREGLSTDVMVTFGGEDD